MCFLNGKCNYYKYRARRVMAGRPAKVTGMLQARGGKGRTDRGEVETGFGRGTERTQRPFLIHSVGKRGLEGGTLVSNCKLTQTVAPMGQDGACNQKSKY